MTRWMFFNLIEVTVLIFLCGVSLKELDYDYTLESIKLVNGDKHTVIDIALRVIKVKEGYLLNGTVDILQDLGEKNLIAFDVEYSAMGNNMFVKSPLRIPTSPICDFLNTTYKDYVEHNFVGKSNLPIIPPEGLCPLPKGNYYFKQINMTSDLAPAHLSSGLWKIEVTFLLETEKLGGIQVIFRTLSKV